MALQLRRGTNAERLLITPQQGELIFVTDYLAVSVTGTTIATNVITFSANHSLVIGQQVKYIGDTANGLTQGTVYYVKTVPATNTVTLSTTNGGATLALTNGTGLTLVFSKSPTNASGAPIGTSVSPLWVGNGTTVGGVSAQASVLDDLLDVTLTSLAEGQTFYYDATTQQWRNTGILTINDTAQSVSIVGSNPSYITLNDSYTTAPSAPLILRHLSTGTVGTNFGTTIGFEAETVDSSIKTIGYLDYVSTNSTVGQEDYAFRIGLMSNGSAPSTIPVALTLSDTGDLSLKGNITVNSDSQATDSYISFTNPTKTGNLVWNSNGTGLFINGNFDVAGTGTNGTAEITAGYGTTMGIANLFNNTGIGTINIGNGSSTEVNIGNASTGRTQVKSPNLELLGDIKIGGNDIKSSTGNTTITLSDYDVIVAGDLQVNGNNGGVWADITTTKNQATLFPANATTVSLANVATALTLGATTGTTTIRNNASVTLDATVGGDLTVNGANINLNGTTPFLTFGTQADGVNAMYGIRGKSTIDDAWFIGSGSTGDDLGYLEIATGDNAGGTNTGGQIYVRQHNNGSNSGVPWEGGNGIVVNELVLLDNIGNTSIPNDLVIGGNLTVNGTTTTVNSTTLTVDDKNIEIGSVSSPSNTTATGGGITLLGGSDGNKTITWNNGSLGWEFNQSIKANGTIRGTVDLEILGNTYLGSQVGNNITAGNIYTTGQTLVFHSGIDNLTSPNNNPTQDVYITNYRGTQPDSSLRWNETTDRWQHSVDGSTYITMPNQNLDTTSDVTFNTATISGVQIAKNALTDNQGYKISVPKGTDLSLQSGSTLVVDSDYIRFQRNTNTATTIASNVISGFNGNAHNFNVGDRIQYTGATGNGLTQDAYYYVVATSFSTSACRLATTLNGTPITLTSGTGLNLTFFSEGGLGNAYFNLAGGQYAFNRETPSGNYNLEVTGSFNATTNAVIGGDLAVNGGNLTTTSATGNLFSANATVINISNGATGQVNIGNSGTGTVNIKSTTLLQNDLTGASKTFSLFNTITDTLYIGGSATYVGIGASTGNTVIGNSLTVGANTIRASDGTLALTLAPTTGNVTVAGDLFVAGNTILSNGGYSNLQFTNSDVEVIGDLTVTGNDIKKSGGTTVVTFSGTNLTTFAGDIIVTGNTISSSTLPAIEMSGADVSIYGDLTVTGNDIKSSSATALTLTGSDVTVVGDLQVTGNDIKSSTGAIALTLSGSDVSIAGNLTVNGTTTTLNSTTLTVDDKNIELGSVTTPTDTTASGGGITLKGATDKTIIWNNSTTGWEFNQPIKVTGNAVLTGDLDVQGADITNSTGALQLTTATNNHIKLTPNGTGNVYLEASTIGFGDTSGSLGAQLTTNGAGDLRLDTNNSSNSGYINITTGVNGDITIAPNGTGKVVVTGDLAVNGGDITTTSTSATLFNTNATAIAIGSSSTITTFANTVLVNNLLTLGNVTTDLSGTNTLTQTTAYQLTSTTRKAMKILLNITDNVTKDVHMVEVLVTTKIVSGVGTVYMTTFGEVTSAGHLATFSADYDNATSSVRFFVTPLSTNSTAVAYTRKSIN